MKTIREQQVGQARLRMLESKGTFLGVVIRNGKASAPITHCDPERLWKRLTENWLMEDPAYFGFDGAKTRFLRIFEGGFHSHTFEAWERQYKVDAKVSLEESLLLERAGSATVEDCVGALRVFTRTDLLSVFEKARVRDVLKSADGPEFLGAAAAVAGGDFKVGLSTLERLMKKHGQPSWPAATYLPFLWRPQEHMFLKPSVTCDFADRVGHPFRQEYSPRLEAGVYESLLDLAAATEAELRELEPRDRIDVQSFIWIVGKYTEADEAQVRKQAANERFT